MTEHTHKKARTSIPFLPDPSKWIQTGSGSGSGSGPSSASKKPAQRPLVSLRNAFATPSTTVKRRPPPGSEAPVANSERQGSLTGFLTPPPTATQPRLQARPQIHHATQGTRPARRPIPTPLQAHRSAPVTSSSSSSDLAALSPPRTKRTRRTLTSSPEAGVEADVEQDLDPELEPAPSSDYPTTPVPDHILDIHRRLCGRDSERMKRVKSPWRVLDGNSAKVDAVESPSRPKAGGRSKQVSPVKAKPAKRDLHPKGQDKENARGRRSHKEARPELESNSRTVARLTPVKSTATPKRRPARQPSVQIRSPLGSSIAAGTRDLSPSAIYRAFRPPSISPPSKLRPARASAKSPTPSSPTPKKRRLTPSAVSPPQPAARGSGRDADFEPVTMDAETLMTWSLGPNRSSIKRPAPVPHEDSGETQSLAPSHASQSFPNFLSSPTRRTVSVSPQKADVGRLPGTKSMLLPESIAHAHSPTRPARQGSGLLSRSRTSIARFPTDLGVPETIHAPAGSPTKHDVSPIRGREASRGKSRISLSRLSPDAANAARSPIKENAQATSSGGKKKARKSGSQWPDFAIGPGPGPSTSSPASGTTPKPKYPRAPPQQPQQPAATQSKLAAFGFFSDRPPKRVRGFDEAWDDEEDLAFDPEPATRPEEHAQAVEHAGHVPVPQPPPHPSLRPAGLRELQRRQAETPPAPLASSSSQPTDLERTSSLTTSSEEVGSAAAWWDGLGDRRSSEFGSLA